jgi:hypothetical protein
MARLAQFMIDAKAIEDGEWIRPDEDRYDDLEILTRGHTNAYKDALSRKLQKAAVGFQGRAEKVPSSIRESIVADVVADFLVLDVRNLTGRDGKPVTADQFRALLRDPSCKELVEACLTAAQQVGRVKEVEIEDALGN